MRIYKGAAAVFLFILLLLPAPGCYTVIWEPDKEFPQKNYYEDYDDFYPETFYGNYYYYYGYPWWLEISPPVKKINVPERDQNGNMEHLRNNSGSGRAASERNSSIPSTPPVTRSKETSSSDNSGSGSQPAGTTETTQQSGSGNNQATPRGSESKTRSNSNSDDNNLRNNDSNRSTSSGRK